MISICCAFSQSSSSAGFLRHAFGHRARVGQRGEGLAGISRSCTSALRGLGQCGERVLAGHHKVNPPTSGIGKWTVVIVLRFDADRLGHGDFLGALLRLRHHGYGHGNTCVVAKDVVGDPAKPGTGGACHVAVDQGFGDDQRRVAADFNFSVRPQDFKFGFFRCQCRRPEKRLSKI